jgi:hypothetical protein
MDFAMPALPSEVDIRADLQDVCFVPKVTGRAYCSGIPALRSPLLNRQ